jgi:hypothetical protein
MNLVVGLLGSKDGTIGGSMGGMIDGPRRFDGNGGRLFGRHDSVVEVEGDIRVSSDGPEGPTALDDLEAHHAVQNNDDNDG